MKPTLIIADDVKAIRESLYSTLQDDFEILGAFEDARSVFEGVLRLRPTLVLMDLVMPAMSGLEVIDRIRANVPSPPKIVILSGVTEEKWVIEAFEKGVGDYLFKPVSEERLLHALHSQLVDSSTTAPILDE
jgi:DNA-binding NarL/FixJ family response regulator